MPDQPQPIGLSRRDEAAEQGGSQIREFTLFQHEDLDRLDPSAQLEPIETPQLQSILSRQRFHDRGCDQGFVVAGMLEKASGDVDRVAEKILAHLHDLATRHADLQPQRLRLA